MNPLLCTNEPLTPTPVPDGRRFSLDPVEAARELNTPADEHKDAANGEHLESLGPAGNWSGWAHP